MSFGLSGIGMVSGGTLYEVVDTIYLKHIKFSRDSDEETGHAALGPYKIYDDPRFSDARVNVIRNFDFELLPVIKSNSVRIVKHSNRHYTIYNCAFGKISYPSEYSRQSVVLVIRKIHKPSYYKNNTFSVEINGYDLSTVKVPYFKSRDIPLNFKKYYNGQHDFTKVHMVINFTEKIEIPNNAIPFYVSLRGTTVNGKREFQCNSHYNREFVRFWVDQLNNKKYLNISVSRNVHMHSGWENGYDGVDFSPGYMNYTGTIYCLMENEFDVNSNYGMTIDNKEIKDNYFPIEMIDEVIMKMDNQPMDKLLWDIAQRDNNYIFTVEATLNQVNNFKNDFSSESIVYLNARGKDLFLRCKYFDGTTPLKIKLFRLNKQPMSI